MPPLREPLSYFLLRSDDLERLRAPKRRLMWHVAYSKNNQNVTNPRTEPSWLVRHGEPRRILVNLTASVLTDRTAPYRTFSNIYLLSSSVRCGSVQSSSPKFGSKFAARQDIRQTDLVRIFSALRFDYLNCMLRHSDASMMH